MNKKSAWSFKRAGQNKCAGGNFFLKINKRADQNKAVQGGFFFSKLINVHTRVYSWSISHILEEEFFSLGSFASYGWKFLWVFLSNFRGRFFNFLRAKKLYIELGQSKYVKDSSFYAKDLSALSQQIETEEDERKITQTYRHYS